MRGVKYAVLKNPDKLTGRQSEAFGDLRDTDPKGRFHRSWRLRELLRMPPKRPADQARAELDCSNARFEASDNRIKVTIRTAYGFRHVNNLIALVMLRCGGLDIRLPQPRTQPTKTAEASFIVEHMSEQIEHSAVAVLLPCCNEEVTIGKVIRDFHTALPEAAVYVYDNNSTDRTAEIAAAEGAVVRKEPWQGKGNVVRAMFEDIDADVYVMADGDDTYPADAAPDMVAKVLEGYDMVIGDRLSSTYFQENKRPFHNFGNRLVRGSINGLFGAHVTDIMTGYLAFSFTFVKTYPVLSRGFEIEPEMTIHSLNNNLRLYEMPIQYRDRPEGSVSKLDTVGDGIKVMGTIFRMIREYKPLPFSGTLGLIIGVVGLVLCSLVTLEFAKIGIVTHFPTLIGAVMLVIAGLLLIVTGIILDVMAKNDRKYFVVDANKFAYLKRLHIR